MIRKAQFRFAAELYGKLIKPDGEIIDLGLLSTKYITDAFAEFYIQCLLGNEVITGFKYHDSGIGTTPADEADDCRDS